MIRIWGAGGFNTDVRVGTVDRYGVLVLLKVAAVVRIVGAHLEALSCGGGPCGPWIALKGGQNGCKPLPHYKHASIGCTRQWHRERECVCVLE